MKRSQHISSSGFLGEPGQAPPAHGASVSQACHRKPLPRCRPQWGRVGEASPVDVGHAGQAHGQRLSLTAALEAIHAAQSS